MDLEVSIAERLQKLRHWQIEQQEKLLKEQRRQREILSHEQDCIYKALGLSICNDLNEITENTNDTSLIGEIMMDMKQTIREASIEIDGNSVSKITEGEISKKEYYEYCNEEENENSDSFLKTIDNNTNFNSDVLSEKVKLSTDMLIEGIKPLSLDNDVITLDKGISIDDVPILSSKKDFHTLLEEKLKKEAEVVSNQRCTVLNNKKKPFLKKGHGLSRFKDLNLQITKKGNLSLGTQRKTAKNNKSAIHKNIVSQSKSISTAAVNATQQLSLKTVSLPRKLTASKSESIITPTKLNRIISDQSKSEFDSKTERELEEVRIFELLEEKAENSSFCSTSSTVVAFLQQSTPFKMRKGLKYIEDGITHTHITNRKVPSNNEQTSGKQVEQDYAGMPHNLKLPTIHRYYSPSRRQMNNNKNSHSSPIDVVGTINTAWNTVKNDTEENMEKYLIVPNEILQDKEADDLENDAHVITTVSSSDSDEVEEEDMGNEPSLSQCDSDVNHRVRFSEYNEYRTIDSVNVSNASNKSTLINYLEEEDLNDCSVNVSTSSDGGSLLLDCEKQMCSSRAINNEKTLSVSMETSSPFKYNIRKDSHYCAVKNNASIADEKDERSGNCSRNLSEDEEEMIRGDNKRSLMVQLEACIERGSSDDEEKGEEEYVERSELGKITEKAKEIDFLNVEMIEHDVSLVNRGQNNFEPEILRTRLLELEKEINIFRKESSALLLQRQKLQEDETALRKEYMEKERNFEESKRRIQNQLQEEKKRLTREKVAMENRIRDAQDKARQNKLEKQKIQNLQEQVEKLRDELNIKESRWTAAESRYKSELRSLRVEISKLKQEMTSLQNIKKITNTKNMKRQINTKSSDQINHTSSSNKRNVALSSKEICAKTSRGLSLDISIHDENENGNNEINEGITIIPIINGIDVNDDLEGMEDDVIMSKNESIQPKCAERNIAKKRDLYENLLKDATLDLMRTQQYSSHVIQRNIDPQQESLKIKNNETNKDNSCFNSIIDHFVETNNIDRPNELTDRNDLVQELSPEKMKQTCSRYQASKKDSTDVVKQIQHSDGRIECLYPNGNVKKIFPDQGITKMIYYNGDVRETDKNGKVKYFYATTRTWHTTTLDGLEILEFPDGQVEKRSSDGTIEVSFPDGVLRIAHANGMEKWILPDGTVAETFANGDKTLSFPNGQREIHTKEHKRREYPDGTVKLVYIDGTQETRYSTGRKRLKDKDGNLLMDSYDN